MSSPHEISQEEENEDVQVFAVSSQTAEVTAHSPCQGLGEDGKMSICGHMCS